VPFSDTTQLCVAKETLELWPTDQEYAAFESDRQIKERLLARAREGALTPPPLTFAGEVQNADFVL